MAAELETDMDKSGGSEADGLDSSIWDGLIYLENVAGPGAVAELVDAFIRDTAPRIEHLREALACGDRVRISKLAHDLKSNAGTLGARRLSALARRMEESAEELASEELEAMIGDAEEEALRATHAIRARLQKLKA